MSVETVPLWDKAFIEESKASFEPFLETYLLDTEKPLGTVVVCPGGGYSHRAPHEGGTIAQRFNDFGFNAVVVQYRVAPHRHPAPIQDVSRAIKITRANAAKWKVKPDKIAVCGFSAGGHLAASIGVHFGTKEFFPRRDKIDDVSNRPDGLILCYPVLSWGEFGHTGSFNSLLGENAPESMREMMSLDKRVTKDTPPAFLWHTAADGGVHVGNSLLFASAMKRCEVPVELHVFPLGGHGMGLAPGDAHVAQWFGLCVNWLRLMGW